MNRQGILNKQKGIATLAIAIVLLIGVTLVAIMTAKTVLVETKINADNYRSMQAIFAADYAMDYALNYIDNGGFDQDGDNILDDVDPFVDLDGDTVHDNNFPPSNITSGTQTVSAVVSFDISAGTRCVPVGATPSPDSGMITATGYSDDGVAKRMITQCVGPYSVLKDDGPDMPLISRSDVALTGNANIVNRYTNINIWSGKAVKIGSSSSMSTYIKDPAAVNLTQTELLDTDGTVNTQLVSNKNLGNGLDIIDNDPSLDTLTPADYFENFFTTDYDGVERLADNGGQRYTNIDDAIGKTGLIWVEGDQSLNSNGQVGSISDPAIMIVNGNLQATGGPTIYGLLYVVGQFNVAGTVNVVGTSIVEGNGVVGDAVTGNGTLNLIYWQDFLQGSGNVLPGETTLISGSWRDW